MNQGVSRGVTFDLCSMHAILQLTSGILNIVEAAMLKV